MSNKFEYLVFPEPLVPEKMQGTLVAWRLRNGVTDRTQAYQVGCRWEITSAPAHRQPEQFQDGFRLTDGGVTGYESFYLDDHAVGGSVLMPYWPACAGGSGWDQQRIAQSEMRRVLALWADARGVRLGICSGCRQVGELSYPLPGEPGGWYLLPAGQACSRPDHQRWEEIFR